MTPRFEQLKAAVALGDDEAFPLLLKECERRGYILQDIASTIVRFFEIASTDSKEDFKEKHLRTTQLCNADILLAARKAGLTDRKSIERNQTEYRPLFGLERLGAYFCGRCSSGRGGTRSGQKSNYVRYFGFGWKTVHCQRCISGVLPGQEYVHPHRQEDGLTVLEVLDLDRPRPIRVQRWGKDKHSWFSWEGLTRPRGWKLHKLAEGPIEKIWRKK